VVDVVYARLFLHHVPDKDWPALFAAITTMLAPGGLFVCKVRGPGFPLRTGQTGHTRTQFMRLFKPLWDVQLVEATGLTSSPWQQAKGRMCWDRVSSPFPISLAAGPPSGQGRLLLQALIPTGVPPSLRCYARKSTGLQCTPPCRCGLQ
jgi:hypothetical protein